jgi:hypothetical protein
VACNSEGSHPAELRVTLTDEDAGRVASGDDDDLAELQPATKRLALIAMIVALDTMVGQGAYSAVVVRGRRQDRFAPIGVSGR